MCIFSSLLGSYRDTREENGIFHNPGERQIWVKILNFVAYRIYLGSYMLSLTLNHNIIILQIPCVTFYLKQIVLGARDCNKIKIQYISSSSKNIK